ncbi:MAG: hypothetical protein A2046_03270 [Bacteroidetes bacterium GWA2_30_7]|nr:MAG: hypothetical protein A2046_03270 [Bacteroidetes bacterium GWA2_30_7]
MSEQNSSLSDFVKAQRKTLKLTQVELSAKAGVGLRFIRELEQGKKTLRMDKVNEVLRLFDYVLGPVQGNTVESARTYKHEDWAED